MEKRFYYKTADEKGFLSLKSKDNSGKYKRITKEEFDHLTFIPEEKEEENNSL